MATPTAATYNKSGTKATTPVKLDKSVFDVEAQDQKLLKLAYDTYLANGRTNSAVSKTRGKVRGGGKKPWRQKGTGRARAGSIRSPIWRGGGAVFGPTGEANYSKKMSLNVKRQALRQALTLSASEKRIKVIEGFDFKESKTSSTVKLLDKLEASGSVLLVVSNKDDSVLQATRNLKNIKVIQTSYLSVYDIINADFLIFDKQSIESVSEWLGQTKSVSEGKL